MVDEVAQGVDQEDRTDLEDGKIMFSLSKTLIGRSTKKVFLP